MTIHDTIAYLVSLPVPLPSVSHVNVDSSQVGQAIRVYRFDFLGMLNRRSDGTVEAYRSPMAWNAGQPNNSLLIGVLRSQGVYADLASASAALLAPPPSTWVP